MPAESLDPSWRSVIEWGFLAHRQFGTDLIFTFGPLGFLYTDQFQPEVFPVQIIFWASVAVVLGTFVGSYWARVPLIVSLLLTVAVVLALGYLKDPWLFIIPLAAAWEAIDPARPRRWLGYALVGLAIAAGLTKFTVFIGALAVFAIADAIRLATRRGSPYLTVSLIAGSWLLFGAVSGQWGWPAFIGGSLAVAGGYSFAMQLEAPSVEIVSIAIIATMIVVIALLTPASVGGARTWVTRIGVALASAVIGFLMFKAGVVRHDGHIIITAAGLLLLVALVTWRAVGRGAGNAARLLALVAVPFAAYSLLTFQRPVGSGPTVVMIAKRLVWDQPRAAFDHAAALVVGDAAAKLPQAREQALAEIRAAHPLPPLDGTIDVYSWDQAEVLAHGLKYAPRPIFQSYSAYTPALIERNAAFLAGSKAPDFVLFAPQTIDNRLPTLEDGKSWPLLWSRYDAVSLVSAHALLQKREGVDRPILWGRNTVSTIGWKESLALPPLGAGACLWAEVEIDANLAGRLLSTAYKGPTVKMQLELADGSTVRHRFIPGMGRTGFLLSPYIDDVTRFLDACEQGAPSTRREVKRLFFETSEFAQRFFGSQIRVTTKSLAIGGARQLQPDASIARFKAWRDIEDALLRPGVAQCAHPPQLVNGKVLAHAPCKIAIEPPTTGRLEIGFGLMEGAWDPGQTDGVRFEVRGLARDGWKTLVVRELRPRELERDREGGTFVLDVGEDVKKLILLTDTLGNDGWDWSYWGVSQ